MLKMKGGHLPTDIELREKYKSLQVENEKLKEIVDRGLMEKLKKENVQLKQQLHIHKNDLLSESFLLQKPNLRTVEHEESDYSPSEQLNSISSTGNTNKFPKYSKRENLLNRRDEGYNKKEDVSSLAAKTDDGSFKGSTFQRGTGNSIFPSINRGGPRAATRILDRIL
jgi:hypothetical protein